MRVCVISYLIGTVAVSVLLIVGLTALAVAATAGDWKSFEIAIGPVPLFAFEREGTTTTVSAGIGILVVGTLAGLLSAGAAAFLHRRTLGLTDGQDRASR